ncbi:MAG: VPLPA-CTERM sorting domain-containing protein [Thiogranum sp.]|nr:VPLPA-CTERM sorting domain-containing protein [Thiogranum sp.]
MIRNSQPKFRGLLAATMFAATVAASTDVTAALVTVSYQGTVDSFTDVNGTVGAVSSISGSFVYDTEAPVLSSSSTRTIYSPAVTSMLVQGGGSIFPATELSGSSIIVDNNFAFYDAIQISVALDDAFGYESIVIRFNLEDTDGSLFSSTSLPTSLALSDFPRRAEFSLTGNKPGTARNLYDLRIDGDLTAFHSNDATVVPLPAAFPLLVAGLAGLGYLARRKR